MTDTYIDLDVSPDGVAVVLINRPAKRNAMNNDMIAALFEAFDTLRGADHVRIVFLKGAGGVFSAGVDLETLSAQAAHDRDFNEQDAELLIKTIAAFHDLPQLTVALAEGYVAGGAVSLAAAADWVVAKQGVQFSVAAAKLGLNPAHMIPFLIEAVGVRAARSILLTAAPFDAAAAHVMGLASEVVADDAGIDGAMRRLTSMALETSPLVVHAIKDAVRHCAKHKLDDGLLRDMIKRDADSRVSASGREGVKAFLERRAPVWPIE
ncbi:MAG: enoyl-CoA hydratase-related protein [Caulobacterales bacterium]